MLLIIGVQCRLFRVESGNARRIPVHRRYKVELIIHIGQAAVAGDETKIIGIKQICRPRGLVLNNEKPKTILLTALSAIRNPGARPGRIVKSVPPSPSALISKSELRLNRMFERLTSTPSMTSDLPASNPVTTSRSNSYGVTLTVSESPKNTVSSDDVDPGPSAGFVGSGATTTGSDSVSDTPTVSSCIAAEVRAKF
ncbi:hypothetical protein [Ruegeria sp. HKCCA5426]|uniref:hypothetical protein n=1 Tax=Ruegeria sp. HKCCA5426 TaxID=2682985 RepID=UPI00148A076A|nr:hypothetical protein [Ruegeria sp. HKCCA5426]